MSSEKSWYLTDREGRTLGPKCEDSLYFLFLCGKISQSTRLYEDEKLISEKEYLYGDILKNYGAKTSDHPDSYDSQFTLSYPEDEISEAIPEEDSSPPLKANFGKRKFQPYEEPVIDESGPLFDYPTDKQPLPELNVEPTNPDSLKIILPKPKKRKPRLPLPSEILKKFNFRTDVESLQQKHPRLEKAGDLSESLSLSVVFAVLLAVCGLSMATELGTYFWAFCLILPVILIGFDGDKSLFFISFLLLLSSALIIIALLVWSDFPEKKEFRLFGFSFESHLFVSGTVFSVLVASIPYLVGLWNWKRLLAVFVILLSVVAIISSANPENKEFQSFGFSFKSDLFMIGNLSSLSVASLLYFVGLRNWKKLLAVFLILLSVVAMISLAN